MVQYTDANIPRMSFSTSIKLFSLVNSYLALLVLNLHLEMDGLADNYISDKSFK